MTLKHNYYKQINEEICATLERLGLKMLIAPNFDEKEIDVYVLYMEELSINNRICEQDTDQICKQDRNYMRINRQICKQDNTPKQIFQLLSGYVNHVNVVTGLHRIAKYLKYSKKTDKIRVTSSIDFLNLTNKLMSYQLSIFNPREISNIVWSYTKLGLKDRNLFKKISTDICKRQLSTFNPQDISNIVWSYTKLGFKDPNLFKKLSTEICKRQLSTFKYMNVIQSFLHKRTSKKIPDQTVKNKHMVEPYSPWCENGTKNGIEVNDGLELEVDDELGLDLDCDDFFELDLDCKEFRPSNFV